MAEKKTIIKAMQIWIKVVSDIGEWLVKELKQVDIIKDDFNNFIDFKILQDNLKNAKEKMCPLKEKIEKNEN